MRQPDHSASPTLANHRVSVAVAHALQRFRDDCTVSLAVAHGVLGLFSLSVVCLGFATALQLATVPVSVMDTLHRRSHRWLGHAQPRKEVSL